MTRVLEAAGVVMAAIAWAIAWACLIALVAVGVGMCSGCTAAQVVAAKPVLDVSCAVARRACTIIEGACDLVSPTAGGEAAE